MAPSCKKNGSSPPPSTIALPATIKHRNSASDSPSSRPLILKKQPSLPIKEPRNSTRTTKIKTMNPQEYIDTLNWRYACKKFNPQAHIDAPTWDALEESLHLSPSSIGLQLWHFIVVDTPALRAQLREVSWGQAQVTDADRYVILCTRRDATTTDVDALLNLINEKRHPSPEKMKGTENFMKGYINGFDGNDDKKQTWLESQVHIALGFLVSAAANLKVDSCVIGGMDRDACDNILGLTNTPYRSLVGVALGYRSQEDEYAQQIKVRFPKNSVIEHR
ncbi:MAG: NAD(P)H-dependent oxidoreductase [Akkermansia sp.]